MQITTNLNNFTPVRTPASQPAETQIQQDNFTFVEPPPDGYNPKAPVPGGKWILGAAAGLAMGALGAYAGFNAGAGPAIAGLIAGGTAGAVGAGAVGLYADIAGGLMSNTNHSKTTALAGAVIGGAAGAAIGAFCANPVAGWTLGVAAAITGGLTVTAWADENLPK